MINEDRKERYYEFKLKTTVNNIAPIQAQMKRVSQFENTYGKDLCDFNIEEILEMYKLLSYTSFDALLVVNSTLVQYTDWCMSENLVINGQNNYRMLTSNMIMQLLNKTLVAHQIVTRDTVLNWIKELTNPRDKFIVLSIFEFGKSKCNFEDTVYARIEDIDTFSHKMKLHSGRIVDVSDELIQIAKESAITLNVMPPYTNKYKLEETGTIIKKPKKRENTPAGLGRDVYSCLKKALDSIDVKCISANSIHLSGEIHMIKRLAKKYEISCEEVLKKREYYSEVEYQYGSSIRPSLFLKKYGNYL